MHPLPSKRTLSSTAKDHSHRPLLKASFIILAYVFVAEIPLPRLIQRNGRFIAELIDRVDFRDDIPTDALIRVEEPQGVITLWADEQPISPRLILISPSAGDALGAMAVQPDLMVLPGPYVSMRPQSRHAYDPVACCISPPPHGRTAMHVPYIRRALVKRVLIRHAVISEHLVVTYHTASDNPLPITRRRNAGHVYTNATSPSAAMELNATM